VHDDFIKALGKHIGEFAGAMDESEFNQLVLIANENNLQIHHIRKVFNAFWVLCHTILPFLVFSGIAKDKHTIRLDDFVKNIDLGINNLSKYMHDLLPDPININVIKHVIMDGLTTITDPRDPDRIITQNHLYSHVIKMTYIGSRLKNTTERDSNVCGYRNNEMNSASDIISEYLSKEEKFQVKPGNIFPWNGNSIFGVNMLSYHSTFCTSNNIYFVSGRSGSTFELMMLILIIFPSYGKNLKLMKGLLMYFIHFHVIRGTHSILETILAFYDIIEYLQIIENKDYISLELIMFPFIVGKTLIINKNTPCENLLTGQLYAEQKIEYLL
jgi:hypothetical protein